jgi:hypothetical protein
LFLILFVWRLSYSTLEFFTDCSFEFEIQKLFRNIISIYFDALTLGPTMNAVILRYSLVLSAFMIRDSCILRRSVQRISTVSIHLFVSSLISNIRVHRKTFNYLLHYV